MNSLLGRYSQNQKLPIRLVSPTFGRLSDTESQDFTADIRTPYYFFLLMLKGRSSHTVDLQSFEVEENELLFILPQQLHEQPKSGHGSDYFKIGFDESCLSLLPTQYPFLVNPLNTQKVRLTSSTSERIAAVFEILLALLTEVDTDPALILAHLNSLLTEINSAYFLSEKQPADGKFAKYLDFRVFVENNLTDHPTIKEIAEELAINPNGLYHLVKHYSGLSPKEFMTNRLILEARRRLYYGRNTSLKELAFDLGFNDPEYFSRLFKKVTGKTIADFYQDLSGN